MIGLTARAEIDDGASNAYQAISDAAEISLPDVDLGKLERTPVDQTSDAYKRYRPTLLEPGSIKVEVFHSSALYVRMKTIQEGRALKNLRIIGPTKDDDGNTYTTRESFTYFGFISKVGLGKLAKDGHRMLSIEFTVSGGVTHVPAA